MAEHANRPAKVTVDPAVKITVDANVLALWGKFQGHLLVQVETLEEAIAALRETRLDSELRGRAERDAHRLAGSAGTFGRHRGSVLARELEKLFTGTDPIDPAVIPNALTQVELLRKDLEGTPSNESPKVEDLPLVLVVHENAELCSAIGVAAGARGLTVKAVENVTAARMALADTHPALALVDLELTGDLVLGLVRELNTRMPPVVVMGLTGDTSFADRVEAVRAGVRGFLPSSLSPNELVGAAIENIEMARGEHWRLLAVDDDPSVLGALVALLEPIGMEFRGVTEAERFWEVLSETTPDIVVLDFDMPEVSGVELCRLLRADPRWSALPVVFLTSRVSSDAIKAVFAAGADDYVAKPVIGPELVTRLNNRLERTRILRLLAETDPLTGLANRRKFEAQWNRLQAMADRYEQPLSFVLLDLDHFRSVNNLYGHDVGDLVLQRIGQVLLEQFRGEDVVARWGGEEIALALYGMNRVDGARRLSDVLGVILEQVITTPDGRSFHVSFSAGVSEYGVDGTAINDLYRRADESLYTAKSLGRARVLHSGSHSDIQVGNESMDDVTVKEVKDL